MVESHQQACEVMENGGVLLQQEDQKGLQYAPVPAKILRTKTLSLIRQRIILAPKYLVNLYPTGGHRLFINSHVSFRPPRAGWNEKLVISAHRRGGRIRALVKERSRKNRRPKIDVWNRI